MEPNINSSGMLNNIPTPPKENRKIGPIVGVLVIVLLIIIAALYFLGRGLNTNTQTDTGTQAIEMTNDEAKTDGIDANTSAAIESDLDAQLKDIDYSF